MMLVEFDRLHEIVSHLQTSSSKVMEIVPSTWDLPDPEMTTQVTYIAKHLKPQGMDENFVLDPIRLADLLPVFISQLPSLFRAADHSRFFELRKIVNINFFMHALKSDKNNSNYLIDAAYRSIKFLWVHRQNLGIQPNEFVDYHFDFIFSKSLENHRARLFHFICHIDQLTYVEVLQLQENQLYSINMSDDLYDDSMRFTKLVNVSLENNKPSLISSSRIVKNAITGKGSQLFRTHSKNNYLIDKHTTNTLYDKKRDQIRKSRAFAPLVDPLIYLAPPGPSEQDTREFSKLQIGSLSAKISIRTEDMNSQHILSHKLMQLFNQHYTKSRQTGIPQADEVLELLVGNLHEIRLFNRDEDVTLSIHTKDLKRDDETDIALARGFTLNKIDPDSFATLHEMLTHYREIFDYISFKYRVEVFGVYLKTPSDDIIREYYDLLLEHIDPELMSPNQIINSWQLFTPSVVKRLPCKLSFTPRGKMLVHVNNDTCRQLFRKTRYLNNQRIIELLRPSVQEVLQLIDDEIIGTQHGLNLLEVRT